MKVEVDVADSPSLISHPVFVSVKQHLKKKLRQACVRTHASNSSNQRGLILVYENSTASCILDVKVRHLQMVKELFLQARDLFALQWYLDSPRACLRGCVCTQALID